MPESPIAGCKTQQETLIIPLVANKKATFFLAFLLHLLPSRIAIAFFKTWICTVFNLQVSLYRCKFTEISAHKIQNPRVET